MDVAEVTSGTRPRLISSDRSFAKIGESVFASGFIADEAINRACTILRRLSGTRTPRMRAVATAALRDAGNRAVLIERGSAALGHPIEIISGEEEGRLIEWGVRSHMPQLVEKPLIVDVGGGSAEIIFGSRMWSLPLGALRLQTMFLHHDPPAPEELRDLFRHIEATAAPATAVLQNEIIEQVVGTSATARIVAPTDVRVFFRQLCALDVAARAQIESIGPNRAGIIIPGAAVLLHLLEALRLPGLTYSPAALCAGIIADLAASGT